MRLHRAHAFFALAVGLGLHPAPARAVTEGEGSVSVSAGWRLTPNDWFSAEASRVGTPLLKPSQGGPLAVASFGYGALPWLEVRTDVFAAGERLLFAGAPALTSVSYGAVFGPRFCPSLGAGFELSFGLFTGPVLVYEEGLGLTQPSEQLAQGLMVEAGIGWRLQPNLSITAEYRLLMARGYVPGYGGINGGGSGLTVGVTFWIEPTGGSMEPHLE